MELGGEGGEKAAKCSDKTSHLRYFIHNILDFVLIGSLIIVLIDLKKGQICVFGSFLGPNGPFRLFSHHILCPTGLMKE